MDWSWVLITLEAVATLTLFVAIVPLLFIALLILLIYLVNRD